MADSKGCRDGVCTVYMTTHFVGGGLKGFDLRSSTTRGRAGWSSIEPVWASRGPGYGSYFGHEWDSSAA